MDISIITFHSCGGQQAIVNNVVLQWLNAPNQGANDLFYPLTLTTHAYPMGIVTGIGNSSFTVSLALYSYDLSKVRFSSRYNGSDYPYNLLVFVIGY